MVEKESLLILDAVPGFGGATIRRLEEYYGSAAEVLKQTEARLRTDAVIPLKQITSLANFPQKDFLARELSLVRAHKVHVLTQDDPGYPDLLKAIPDAPVVLYVKGTLPADQPLNIALVGSRKTSVYGRAIAEQFAMRLAELGFVIHSGMARGIDTAAHQGVLRAGGQTVAVLGCGLSVIYPPENKDLFDQIAASGAVISEFPMETPPLATNFPRRNRIISGLSLGVVVIEAAKRSGALITADCALEQGRDVFAVPGQVNSPTAHGVNNLIKQGARLVMGVEDIIEEYEDRIRECLGMARPGVSAEGQPTATKDALSEDEQQVYAQVGDRPVYIDDLLCAAQGDVSPVSILFQLEMKKLIRQLPGKFFVRITH